MSDVLPVDAPLSDAVSDADLIREVRSGDTAAYGELFDRHRQAAQRLAGQLVRGPDADDLVAEAFTRLLVLLQDGKGPDEAFRAYLLTAIRRLHVDRIRSVSRTRPTDDDATFDRRVDFVDPTTTAFENAAAKAAFASLPERWQLVLWHLEVEGQKPAEIAPLLGMSANSVSALAYRAREGLRQAYLQGHLADATDVDCKTITPLLGGYVRKGLSARDTTKVEAHLDTCRRCAGLYLELAEVNSGLGAWIAPAVLGAAAWGYLASTGVLGTAAAAGAAAGLAGAGGAPSGGPGGASSGGASSGGASGAASAGAASGGVAGGGITAGGGLVGSSAAVGGSGAATGALTTVATAGTGAVGGAGSLGAAAVAGGIVQTAALPLKALAATVGAQGAAASVAVVASVATGVGVVAVRHDAGPPAQDVVATAPTATAPAPEGGAATEDPAPDDSTPSDPTPSPDATTEPAADPAPPATDETEEAPAPSVDATQEPAPEPSAPAPEPVTSDYRAGAPSITNDSTLLQRRVSVPVTVAATGEQPASVQVTMTVQFTSAVVFRGIPGGGWTCNVNRNQLVTAFQCQASLPSGQSFAFLFKAAGIRPTGYVTVTTPGDADTSNDQTSFASGAWILTL